MHPVVTNVQDFAQRWKYSRKRWLNGDNCSSVQELKVIGGIILAWCFWKYGHRCNKGNLEFRFKI